LNRSTLWLQPHPAESDPLARFFCLPHAGGGATAFHSWTAELPAIVQLCPVQLPGRETRLSETLYTQIDSLVDAIYLELQPWTNIPFAVYGHSMGALLAFELVRRLQCDGYPLPAWLFISGRCAPDVPCDTNLLHSLPDREFISELARLYGGISQEFMENEALREVFLPILRADVSVVESYQFREGEPLNCPITAFSGMSDASVSWDQLVGWKRQTNQRFAMQVLPGGHFYPQQPMLKTISTTLAELWSQLG
jgi:surfactin synthase thioesterase subunit